MYENLMSSICLMLLIPSFFILVEGYELKDAWSGFFSFNSNDIMTFSDGTWMFDDDLDGIPNTEDNCTSLSNDDQKDRSRWVSDSRDIQPYPHA